MGAENRVSLKIDTKKRIGVSDVITMLKGLRSEAIINIVRTSDAKDNAETLNLRKAEKEVDSGRYQYESSIQDAINITSTVTGNTELPQIRELPSTSSKKLCGIAKGAGLDIPESAVSSYRKRLQSLKII